MTRHLINPNLLADETGLKNSKNPYQCRSCGKKANLDKAVKRKWHYRIHADEKDLIYLEEKRIGYVPLEKITYLCYEDYSRLPLKEKSRFVEIELPYFLALIKNKGGVFSF